MRLGRHERAVDFRYGSHAIVSVPCKDVEAKGDTGMAEQKTEQAGAPPAPATESATASAAVKKTLEPGDVVRRCLGLGKPACTKVVERLGEQSRELPRLYEAAMTGGQRERDRLRHMLLGSDPTGKAKKPDK